jgi:spectinomycin phosphotransferase
LIDLRFVVGGLDAALVGPREEAWFFAGYGATTVDRLTLAYYRHARALADIADYGQRVFLLPAAGAATKRAAVQGLRDCFRPGALVGALLSSRAPAAP